MNWEDIIKEIRRKPQTRISGGEPDIEQDLSEEERTLVEDTRRSTFEFIIRLLKDMGEDELVQILEKYLTGVE